MGKYKVSDPMRLFTLVVSVLFVAIGVTAIVSGNSDGWLIAGFFGLCLLVAVFEPWFSKPWVTCDYRLVITNDEIACEHPKRGKTKGSGVIVLTSSGCLRNSPHHSASLSIGSTVLGISPSKEKTVSGTVFWSRGAGFPSVRNDSVGEGVGEDVVKEI